MSVCEPLIQGVSASADKTRQRLVYGGLQLMSNGGTPEADDQNPCTSATHSDGSPDACRMRNALIYIGVNASGKAIVQGVKVTSAANIQTEKPAGIALDSANITADNAMTVFDSSSCTVDVESIPVRNFSTMTSTFATETIGEPAITILSEVPKGNDPLPKRLDDIESSLNNHINTDKAKAATSWNKEEERYEERKQDKQQIPDSEPQKKQQQLQNTEPYIMDTAILTDADTIGSGPDADEIEIDLEEEIDTAAFSEQLYSSIASGTKFFERPLIEDVILEECELEENEQQLPSNRGIARPTNAAEPEYRSEIMQRLYAANVTTDNGESYADANEPTKQSEWVQNFALVNKNLSANLCRFEDSPLYQSRDDVEEKPLQDKQSLTSAREAFFRDLDTRIAEAPSLSLENEQFINKPIAEQSAAIQKIIQEPPQDEFENVPRMPNTPPKQQEKNNDSAEKLLVSFQIPKCEELVAQRVTDSALLSGVVEAANLSNVESNNKGVRFFSNETLQDSWRGQSDVKRSQWGSDDVQPTHESVERQYNRQWTQTNTVITVKKPQNAQTSLHEYQNQDCLSEYNTQAVLNKSTELKTERLFNREVTIQRDFANPARKQLPGTAYTYSVSTHPVVTETEEDLVKNFNSLLNEYQSQPSLPRAVPISYDNASAPTVESQERVSTQPAHASIKIHHWDVWENPDIGLPDYGKKLLTNGFVVTSEAPKAEKEKTWKKTTVDEVRPCGIDTPNCQSKNIWLRETITQQQPITTEVQQSQEQQQRQQLKERYQRELLQQQQIRQQQQLQQQKDRQQQRPQQVEQLNQQQQQKQQHEQELSRPDLSGMLTVSTAPAVRNVKSPTPTFGSLHRQNLLQNQYAHSPSSLSPRTLSRINHLNVIIESKSEKDGAEVIHNHPVFVKDTSKYWYKPNITREEAINMLKQKPPGTFVVRDSNSFPGAFGLALKVARPPPNAVASTATQNGGDASVDLVRHFLIEPSPKGVKLKGCANEPVFGTLAALVYQHSITPLALPCKLLLPEYDPALSANEQQQRLDSNQALLERGAACNVTYLCSVDTESLTGPEALRRAAAWSLEDLTRGTLRAIPVHFKVSAQGITLTDNTRSLFFRRHYAAHLVTFAGIDPENRVFDNNNCCQLPPCYVLQAPIFGFVARKYVGGCVENACHVFAELDPDQPASAVVRFITNVMMPQAKNHQIAHLNSQR